MSKILVISGHPDIKHSVANRAILDELQRLLPEAEIVYLDALYRYQPIDVEKEQKRLLPADTLVFEFPVWWYSDPSLLHRYVEVVFTHGFAYGSRGTALNGKKFILSFTTGAPEEAYSEQGAQGYPFSAFLPPFTAMARLTGLDYRGSVISYGMALVNPENEQLRGQIVAKAKEHAGRLVRMIEA